MLIYWLILDVSDVCVSDTSRPMRPGEKEGDAYYFVPREQFDKDIAKNKYAASSLIFFFFVTKCT